VRASESLVLEIVGKEAKFYSGCMLSVQLKARVFNKLLIAFGVQVAIAFGLAEAP